MSDELTDEEKRLLLAKYDRGIKRLEKSLEEEHKRQVREHAPALKEKI